MPDNKIFTEITHDQLVNAGEKWLYNHIHCGIVFSEFSSASQERPDILGCKSYYTILIECKVSRSDFLADRIKPFRNIPHKGIGDYRFYLCPEGIIKIDALPEKWGLLYYTNGKIKKIKCPIGNAWDYTAKNYRFKKNKFAEYQILYGALRRLKIKKYFERIYEKII